MEILKQHEHLQLQSNQVVPETILNTSDKRQQQKQQQTKFKRIKKKDKLKNKKKFLKGENHGTSALVPPQPPKRNPVENIVYYDSGKDGFKTKFDKAFELKEEKMLLDYVEHIDSDVDDKDNDVVLNGFQFTESIEQFYSKPIKNRLKRSKYYNSTANNNTSNPNNSSNNKVDQNILEKLQLDSDEEIDLDLEALSYKKKCRLQRIQTKKTKNPTTNNSSPNNSNKKKLSKYSQPIVFVKSNQLLNEELSNIRSSPPPLMKKVSFVLPKENEIIFLSSDTSSDVSRSPTPVNSNNNNSSNVPNLSSTISSINNIYNNMNSYYNSLMNSNDGSKENMLVDNPNYGYDNIEEFDNEKDESESDGEISKVKVIEYTSEDDNEDEGNMINSSEDEMFQSEEEFDDDDNSDIELPPFEITHITETTTTATSTLSSFSNSFGEDDLYDSLTDSDSNSDKIVSCYINSEPSGDEGFFTNPFKPKDQQAPKPLFGSSGSSFSSCSSLFGKPSNIRSSSSGVGCCDAIELSDDDCYDNDCINISSTEESEHSDIEVISRTSTFADWIKKVHGPNIILPPKSQNQQLLPSSPPQFNSSNNQIIDVDEEEDSESFRRKADSRSLLFRAPLNSYITECLEGKSVLTKEILEINEKGFSLPNYSIKQLTSISNLFDYFIMHQYNKEFPLWTMAKIATHQVEFLAKQYQIYNETRKVKDRNTIFLLVHQGIRKPSNKKKDNYILASYSESGDFSFDKQSPNQQSKQSSPTNNNSSKNSKNYNNKKNNKNKNSKKNKKKFSNSPGGGGGGGNKNNSLPSIKHGDIVAADVSPISSSNVGHMLLKSLGWSGGGLGVKGEGRDEPLQAVIRKNRIGLGFDS
ncbi:hypothetical protein DLAC_05171 [Tieghemostelium lacteum]|uniref:G-patch domain-containing protein n=1 Tax=Tieghemostelium lacteum TaxID=361077 RepID=A0A151ZIQ5_TIELA|nr:hypothetical protein DLAC_05171 [Tieghemostelium lacteum]|eukprot:KYQ93779.1 hypothetical protein DLAC_05171 [Tieghemostelium lacteum]